MRRHRGAAVGDRVVDDPLLVAHQGPAAAYQHQWRLAVLTEVAGQASPEGDERVLAQAQRGGQHACSAHDDTISWAKMPSAMKSRAPCEVDLVGAARPVAGDVVDRSHRPSRGREVADRADRRVGVPGARVVPVDEAGVGAVVDHGQGRDRRRCGRSRRGGAPAARWRPRAATCPTPEGPASTTTRATTGGGSTASLCRVPGPSGPGALPVGRTSPILLRGADILRILLIGSPSRRRPA